MVFSTALFLTIFLPFVLVVSWSLRWLGQHVARFRGRPASWRSVNGFILLASLGFYFWGEGQWVGWLIASVLFNAGAAQLVAMRETPRWRKAWLSVAVVANLLLLGWFKYAGFMARSLNVFPGVDLPIPEVALPLGISFYTFQAMSYVWDVYRRETAPAESLIDFACYVTMFPQLVAGPIVRYVDIAKQLGNRRVDLEGVASGFRRFLCGLAKKAIVANTVALMADAVWGVVEGGGGVSVSLAWIGLICYALQIYYDFSGYSDMAIGMGRMLGFTFKENFLHPYCASSVREFWRRWHISLSTWFRDYVYIPLGGNRKGRFRAGVNALIVFGLCGLWHGASAMFVLWGLWHGLFLMIERFIPQRRINPLRSEGVLTRVLAMGVGMVYTTFVVLMGWVLFRSASLSDAGLMLRSLAGVVDVSREARVLWLELNPKLIVVLAAGCVFSLPVVPWLRGRMWAWFSERRTSIVPVLVYVGEWMVLSVLGVVSMLFIAGGSYNPFLYFRF